MCQDIVCVITTDFIIGNKSYHYDLDPMDPAAYSDVPR